LQSTPHQEWQQRRSKQQQLRHYAIPPPAEPTNQHLTIAMGSPVPHVETDIRTPAPGYWPSESVCRYELDAMARRRGTTAGWHRRGSLGSLRVRSSRGPLSDGHGSWSISGSGPIGSDCPSLQRHVEKWPLIRTDGSWPSSRMTRSTTCPPTIEPWRRRPWRRIRTRARVRRRRPSAGARAASPSSRGPLRPAGRTAPSHGRNRLIRRDTTPRPRAGLSWRIPKPPWSPRASVARPWPVAHPLRSLPSWWSTGPTARSPAVVGQLSSLAGACQAGGLSRCQRIWPRTSPAGRSPGPVPPGAAPSSVCTLT